jgi:hypothetical protein
MATGLSFKIRWLATSRSVLDQFLPDAKDITILIAGGLFKGIRKPGEAKNAIYVGVGAVQS